MQTTIRLFLGMLCLSMLNAAVLAEPIHPRLTTGPEKPGTTILDYNSSNGDLLIYQDPDAEFEITAIEIQSENNIIQLTECPFERTQCRLFDVFRSDKLFKLDPGGFNEVLFPGALEPGLTQQHVADELLVDGAVFLGGSFSDVIMIVPEPTSGVWLLLVGLAFWRRRD